MAVLCVTLAVPCSQGLMNAVTAYASGAEALVLERRSEYSRDVWCD
eukprot:SAG11_NODE_141_length_14934_cov_4.821503_10_plen_46_part_00